MNAARIYLVVDGDAEHLVEATSQAQALRHIAESRLTVRVAKTTDVARLMQSGKPVQKAKASEG